VWIFRSSGIRNVVHERNIFFFVLIILPMRFLRSRKVIQLTDEAAIASYRETSDPKFVGILFDRYSHLVFAIAMHYLKDEEDSKDVVIHVFEQLAVNLRKYEIRNFSGWLYSVTKNHCFRELKGRPFTLRIDESWDHVAQEEPETEAPVSEHLLLYLDEAIDTLNEAQQTCIRLFYLEEKSYREIETVTGYNYEQVKSYIQNGKRNLKIYLLKKK